MKIEVRQENIKCIIVNIPDIGVYAQFEDFDQATKFIQAVILNITAY